jgi:hypothetical protein
MRAFVMREAWHGKGDASSLGVMLKSMVMIATLIFIVLHILAVCALLYANFPMAGLLLLMLFTFLWSVSRKKFGRFGEKIVFINALIYNPYFLGRAISIKRGLLQ